VTRNRLRWVKLKRRRLGLAEEFLIPREKEYVSACACFLTIKKTGHVWALLNEDDEIIALLIHSGRSLYPVFDGRTHVPLPGFLKPFLIKVPIHAVQGRLGEVIMLTRAMKKRGYIPDEEKDYELMSLDRRPESACYSLGPPGLLLRPPTLHDGDKLYELQAAYEREEVLSRKGTFSPAACRATVERLIKHGLFLVAQVDGVIAGKINVSASAFTRRMIGGVFVKPEMRGQGIAARMAAVFFRSIIEDGWGITLFVRKSNIAARATYRKVGLAHAGYYRITYY